MSKVGRATAIVLALTFGSDRLLSFVCEIRCADHAADSSHHCFEPGNAAGVSVSAAGDECVHVFVRFTPEPTRTHFALPLAVVLTSDTVTAVATHPGRIGATVLGHAPPGLVLRV